MDTEIPSRSSTPATMQSSPTSLKQLRPRPSIKPSLPGARTLPAPSGAPRRSVSRVACERCRRRKVKCDADRPSCTECRGRGYECEYKADPSESHAGAQKRRFLDLKKRFDEMSSSHADLDHVFEMIRKRPEDEATAIFHRIRDGGDPASILRHLAPDDDGSTAKMNTMG
ncbi:hypothetical protein F4778DRAFT_733576 [Xylariomycetidae sp. FL2044]|nr:hypothetical protein F4778DRAFT_733576 [Xylariomycetidae sp. FL2044]